MDLVVMLSLKRNLVVAIASIAFLASLVGLMVEPPVYTAAALISIDSGAASSYQVLPDGKHLPINEAILDRVGSSELIDETVDRFGLAADRTRISLADHQDAAIAAVRNGLHVVRTATRSVWKLTYRSSQPILAAAILDDLLNDAASSDAALRAHTQETQHALVGDLQSASAETQAVIARIKAARIDLDAQHAADVKRLKELQDQGSSIEMGHIPPAANSGSATQVGDSASGGLVAGSAMEVDRLDLLNAARSFVALEARQAVFLNALNPQLEGLQRYNTAVLNLYLQAAPPEALQVGVLTHPTPPQEPDPSAARTITAIVALLAAMIGVADIIVRARRRGVFETAKDVEQRLRLPVVATIPRMLASNRTGGNRRVERQPADVVMTENDPAFIESFEVLQKTLGITGSDSRPRVIAICSALPNEGKTTIAACLARLAAKAGRRVVLIDCDGRRRALSRLFADGEGPGLVQWACGDTMLRDIITIDPSGVSFIRHSSSEQVQDLSTPTHLERLLKSLRPDFDVIILDTGPVLALTEARVTAALADQVVLVARWRTTPVRAARLAVALLGEAGAAIKGVALSLADRPSSPISVAALSNVQAS